MNWGNGVHFHPDEREMVGLDDEASLSQSKQGRGLPHTLEVPRACSVFLWAERL